MIKILVQSKWFGEITFRTIRLKQDETQTKIV